MAKVDIEEPAVAGDSPHPSIPSPEQEGRKVADPRRPMTRVRAGALAAALKDVVGAVAARSMIPVLEFVRFEAGAGRIALMATDLDMWVSRDLASDDGGASQSREADSTAWLASIRPFTVLLPAKALAALVGQFDPDALVTVTAPTQSEPRAVIAAGRARFKLNCWPAEDFPLPVRGETGAGFELQCSVLGDLLASVEHAISSDETRYYLNGIYLHPESLDLRAAATDGHRMARVRIDGPEGAASFPPGIIGRRTVALLDKLLVAAIKGAGDGAAPVVLIEAEGELGGFGQAARLRFVMPGAAEKNGGGGEIELVAKTIDGQFPDYARVIPSDPPGCALIGRAALIEAVKRVAVLTEDKTRAVKCQFEADKLTLTVAHSSLGEASEELACSHAGEFTVGFDSKYLLDALQALGNHGACETVAFGLPSDAAGAVRIRAVDGVDQSESDRLVQVLMPVRV